MKKLINSIKNKFNKAVISAKTTIESTSGEGYIDTGVKIIIGVVTSMVNQKLNRSKQRKTKNKFKERTR